MQESIVIISLSAAFAYIIYTFYRKIRHKGGGCCGCGKDCCESTKKTCSSQGKQHLHDITGKK